MRSVVLVEGESDRIALEHVAGRLGVPLDGVELVAMGGITNLRACLARFAGRRVTGLYDGAEERVVVRVLGGTPAAQGFHRCEPDLEGELLRALGVERVLALVDDAGELPSFRRLQQQPAHRGRPLEQQLRQLFAGRSGHKARYAALMADALDAREVPPPLRAVLTAATS